ncbi:MAG TPA: ribonuclease D [Hyphomicrobiales bacterium]|nr:ribonuclease D [Hyphomicrobiales bacterium]
MPVISTTNALAEFCQHLGQSDFVAVDTEFMRQSTYWPELCLVQLASPDDEAVVDPLAPGIDLAPFYELMADASTMKVFHAGRQDVEIIHHEADIIPLPIFDTQIAAMVCGFGEAVSYGALVKRLARKNLDKSSRFTDWSRRPLTDKQLRYALGDVTHLRGIYLKLKEELETSRRSSWVAEEMAELTDPRNYRTEPEDAWKRLKNRARNHSELAIMIELAAWREREAQRQNVPRNRVVKDDTIYDVMVQAPMTLEDLAKLRTVHDGMARSQRGRDMVEAVKTALERPAEELPELPVHEPLPPSAVAAADLLRVLLKAVAAEHNVAAKLIANTEELDKIAVDDNADVPALHGWRRELFGESALAIKSGRLAMSIRNGHIVTYPLDEAFGENDGQSASPVTAGAD